MISGQRAMSSDGGYARGRPCRAWRWTVALGLGTLVTAAMPGATAAAPPTVTAFVDVNVVPMDSNRVLRGQTVVVQGDRITVLGASAAVAVPGGAVRIEGRGRYLLPGLGEMHGHNPPPGASPEYVEAIYFLFLSNGVTTVRSMMCAAGDLPLRERVNSGAIFGPKLFMAGPSFNSSARSPAEAEARVRQQKADGWDLLKVQGSIRRAPYDAMVRTAREIGIRFGGHVPRDVGLAHALESRQETIDHLDGYAIFLEALTAPIDPQRLARAVALTRAAGTAVVPTMQIWDILTGAVSRAEAMSRPEMKYIPATEIQRWTVENRKRVGAANFSRAEARQLAANRRILLKALHDAGVPVLFGTDAPQQFSVPGFSVHWELEVMAEIGMSPYEILKSATRDIGDYFSDTDRFGIVAAGHRADLLLLEANPLEDVGNVAKRAGVMVRGRWLPEAEIQTRLARIAADFAR